MRDMISVRAAAGQWLQRNGLAKAPLINSNSNCNSPVLLEETLTRHNSLLLAVDGTLKWEKMELAHCFPLSVHLNVSSVM